MQVNGIQNALRVRILCIERREVWKNKECRIVEEDADNKAEYERREEKVHKDSSGFKTNYKRWAVST